MTFKVVCVDNSGLENELVVGKLYDANVEDTSRPSRSDWFFLIDGVCNRGNKDNRFNHYRFKRVDNSFIEGYQQAVDNLTKPSEHSATASWHNGYKTAQNYLLKPEFAVGMSLEVGLNESLVLRHSKTTDPLMLAPALIGECVGRIAEMSARSSSPEIEGLIDLYLGWMLKNAAPEFCVMFGRVITESGYKIDKTNNWKKYVELFSGMIAPEKPVNVIVISDTLRLDGNYSLVLQNPSVCCSGQMHGAMYGELKLRLALDKIEFVDKLVSAYIGWFINNNADIKFVMNILKEVKDVVSSDFWRRENVIKANKVATLNKVENVNG